MATEAYPNVVDVFCFLVTQRYNTTRTTSRAVSGTQSAKRDKINKNGRVDGYSGQSASSSSATAALPLAALVPTPPAPPAAAPRPLAVVIGNVTVHPWHRLAFWRGVVWCWRCGAHGFQTPRNLGKECRRMLLKAGRRTLRRLAMGQTPNERHQVWPGGEDDPPPPGVEKFDPGQLPPTAWG